MNSHPSNSSSFQQQPQFSSSSCMLPYVSQYSTSPPSYFVPQPSPYMFTSPYNSTYNPSYNPSYPVYNYPPQYSMYPTTTTTFQSQPQQQQLLSSTPSSVHNNLVYIPMYVPSNLPTQMIQTMIPNVVIPTVATVVQPSILPSNVEKVDKGDNKIDTKVDNKVNCSNQQASPTSKRSISTNNEDQTSNKKIKVNATLNTSIVDTADKFISKSSTSTLFAQTKTNNTSNQDKLINTMHTLFKRPTNFAVDSKHLIKDLNAFLKGQVDAQLSPMNFDVTSDNYNVMYEVLHADTINVGNQTYHYCNVLDIKTTTKNKSDTVSNNSVSSFSTCKKFGRIFLYKELLEWLQVPESFHRRCSKILLTYDENQPELYTDVLLFFVVKSTTNKRKRLCITFRGILKLCLLIKLWLYPACTPEEIQAYEVKILQLFECHSYMTYSFVDQCINTSSSSNTFSSSSTPSPSASKPTDVSSNDDASTAFHKYTTRNTLTYLNQSNIEPNQFNLTEVLSDLESATKPTKVVPLTEMTTENDSSDSETTETDCD
jgi:hypothetical protein